MTRAFTIAAARVAHDLAPVSALEVANHDDPEVRSRKLASRDGVAEAFVLQTCNRVEEYVVADTSADGEAALADAAAGVAEAHVVRSGHEASLRHLLRVAAGLESQVLGEDQVLGQLRSAYLAAEEAGTIGPVLEAALLKAIHVGERARTETAINDGTVSLGSAAVQLADRERGLPGRTVLLVGAGEMAAVVAKGLAHADVHELRLVNRSPERAVELATQLSVPVQTDGLDALGTHLAAADVAVTATASREPIIERSHADDAGDTLVVDLAQPRDVAPAAAEQPGFEVHDLDALEAVTDATHRERRAAAAEVEAIVETELDLLLDQYKRRRADAVIRGMYQGAERLKEREVETALSRLAAADPEGDHREVVEDLADALVAKLLAVPTRSLRDAAAEDDWETVATAIQLFDPSLLDEGDPPEGLRALAEAVGASADAGDD